MGSHSPTTHVGENDQPETQQRQRYSYEIDSGSKEDYEDREAGQIDPQHEYSLSKAQFEKFHLQLGSVSQEERRDYDEGKSRYEEEQCKLRLVVSEGQEQTDLISH